jgi:hypothetical protein
VLRSVRRRVLVSGSEGVLAHFIYIDDFLLALRALKAGGYQIETTFSPIAVDEVEEILGRKSGRIPLITLLGAMSGGLAVTVLAVYAHLSFNFITGGKPVLAWVPWIVVAFEGAILGAVLSSVVAWVLKGRLPRLRTAAGYDRGFSQDCFGVLVTCSLSQREEIDRLMRQRGAGEVRYVKW